MSAAISDSLATELWLEILSYLPRNFRRSMIGVSRALFELALDDIYEELVVCADDEKSLFAINQLKYAYISRRVRRVVVFLRSDNPRKITLPLRNIKTADHSYRPIISGANHSAHEQSPKGQDPFSQLLSIARQNLQSCSNTRELKLVFNRSSSHPCFKPFIRSLWHPKSLGPKIQKLSIQATDLRLMHIFELMSIDDLSRYPPINIRELDLNFCRLLHSVDEGPFCYVRISSFLALLESSLVSLTMSGYLIPHILTVLKASSTFVKLKKLELHAIFNVERDLQELLPLEQFLAKHADTLEHVIMDPSSRDANSDLSSRLYLRWLSRDESFCQQPLPNLRTLELAYQYHWAYPRNCSSPSIFPRLDKIAANLTTLAIKNIELNFDTVADLVSCVPISNGVCTIEALKLHIDILTPKLLDLLVRNLPNLVSLEMFVTCASEKLEDRSPEQYLFCRKIRERKIPSWPLRYLRITCPPPTSSCHEPHPNMHIMEAVKSTLSTSVVLGHRYSCFCPPSINLA